MEPTLEFLVRHGYLILFAFIVAEQVGFPIPSIPILLGAGALARTGELEYAAVIAVGVAGCLAGDGAWYWIGRRRGGAVLAWLCRISLEPDSCVRRTHEVFARHGARALIVAKFVPGLNTAAPPLAGMLSMPPWRFLAFDVAGSLLWMLAFTGLGYVFSEQIERIAVWATGLGGMAGVAIFGPLALYIGIKYLQRRRALRELIVARIAPAELRRLLEAGSGVTVVDMRHALEAASEPETIPGALLLPSDELDARHGEIPRDAEVILFCT